MKYINEEWEKAYAKKLRGFRRIEEEKKKEKLQNEKILTKKERDHLLIVKGTIFERLGLLYEDEEFLLGLIISTEPYELTEEQKKQLRDLGQEFIKMRQEILDR